MACWQKLTMKPADKINFWKRVKIANWSRVGGGQLKILGSQDLSRTPIVENMRSRCRPMATSLLLLLMFALAAGFTFAPRLSASMGGLVASRMQVDEGPASGVPQRQPIVNREIRTPAERW